MARWRDVEPGTKNLVSLIQSWNQSNHPKLDDPLYPRMQSIGIESLYKKMDMGTIARRWVAELKMKMKHSRQKGTSETMHRYMYM
jgi:hypothetical protein